MPVLPKKGISLLAAIALLTIVVAFIPEIIGEDMKTWCAQTLGSHYRYWLLGVFVASVAVLAYLTSDFGESEKDTKKSLLTLSELETYRIGIREWLKKHYEQRRSQKMSGEFLPVNLNFYATLKGVREGDRSSYIEVNVEGSDEQILKIFNKTKGRLLLLGKPGAGKTMQLMELGLNLLEKEIDSMPAVLNLATWTSDFPTLQDWLKRVLPYELGANATLAMKVLSQGRVILLFDGFDEIAQEHRVSFFEKLALYKLAHSHCEFVISTRIDEYLEAAAQKAPPIEYQPIEVAPLNLDQIRNKLKMLEISGEQYARRFLMALDNNPLICKAATIPFYFNCLQTLFTLKPLSEWDFKAKTQVNYEVEILDRFILFELGKCKKLWSQKWLSFLASRMEERKVVRFELRNLQYEWWNGWQKWEVFFGILASWLTIGLKIGIFFGLAYELACFPILEVEEYFGLIISIVFISIFMPISEQIFKLHGRRLLSGLIFGLLEALFNVIEKWSPEIKTKDSIPWTRESFSPFYKKFIQTWIPLGFAAGLIIVAAFVAGSIKMAVSILIVTLTSSGLGALLIYITLNNTSFLQISSPYQRFIASAKILHFSILQHLLLRYQLAKKGLLPLHLVDFLNEMASYQSEKEKQKGKPKPHRFTTYDVHLLESDGATWRFRHRLIQEWFARNWKEE